MDSKDFSFKEIPGWGMDMDNGNDPTYPMKNYTGADHNRINYERSVQQNQNVELLMSTERPQITRVFGTSVPPSGFSGLIRRYAFRHSEDRYRHWIPLILADRINVIEGTIEDISNGYFPNIAAERGWKVELKHNPKGMATKFITLAGVGLLLYLCSSRTTKNNLQKFFRT